uniref:Uncharacterized protein n=1 Tax=Podarcis muralis TaxID=64176 RepID=A0A670IPN1_PODMU
WAALFLVICLSCLMVLSTWRQMHRRLPPGPTPLPILGNFLQLDPNNMLRSLEKVSLHSPPCSPPPVKS